MLQRVQAAVDKAAKTGGDAAVSLGLPAGWAVTPKLASRQVVFTAPDGKRFRSVRELAQVLGEVPKSLSGDTAEEDQAEEEERLAAEKAEAARKAEDELVPKLILNSRGGLLKMVLDMIKSGKTEQEAAVVLGLPSGWLVSPKEASRQVHFIAPDGKRFRSVKELVQAFGEGPESLSGGIEEASTPEALESRRFAEKIALAEEEKRLAEEKAEAARKAEEEVPKPGFNSGGGLLKRVLDVIQSGKTEQEAAVVLGLPSGWLVSPKEASRQVHFISPDGKRFRSVKELGQALGRLPEAFSLVSRDLAPPAPPKKRAEAPTGSMPSSMSKRTRLSQAEEIGDEVAQLSISGGTNNAEKVSMFGAAQAAINKYKTDAEVAEALGLPVGWKVTVDNSMRVVFFHPPGRQRIRGAKQLTALLGAVPEALGGGLRHSRSDFDEDVYIAVRDYIKVNPTTWSLSLMMLELSELHGWSREDSKEEDDLKFKVKAAISRCGYKGLSAMASAYSGPLYKGS